MKLQRFISATLSLISTAVFSGACYAAAEVQTSEQAPDPFLVTFKDSLKRRDPNPADIAKLNEYIEKHPNDGNGHMVLAYVYDKLGMDGMYSSELEKAWRLQPETPSFLISALKGRAVTNDKRHYQSLIEEGFQKYKNDPKNLIKAAELFHSIKENEVAVRFVEQALKIDPKNVEARCNYCTYLLALSRFHEAIDASEPLLSDKTTATLATLIQGVAWNGLKNTRRALPLLEKAWHEAPTELQLAKTYVDALIAEHKYKQAVEPAMMVLAFQPPYGKHLNAVKDEIKPVIERASAADIQANLAKISKMIPPGKTLAFFYFALGDLLDRSGKILAAANCFQEGLSMDDSVGRAYMRLGHDLELLGASPDSVQKLYQQAVLRTGNDKEVVARCQRMTARLPVMDRDIAGKIKNLINSVRYK